MSECFKSFTYNGKSTDNVINSANLILVTFDGISSVGGVTREPQKGGTTITRPVPNEYGTINNANSIDYCLIKDDFEPFTYEEQRTVERWLTSPKFSTDLTVYDTENNEVCIYCGLFTNTSWIPHSEGYAGLEFTFECDSAYPYKEYKKVYTVTSPGSITLNCESDELNEYIYPVLTVEEQNETAIVSITNVTDDGNTMTVRAYDRLKMKFDCQHCIPSDETTSGIISYADLGWDDVGNIYWLRLFPGDNEISVTVTAQEPLEGQEPQQIVGTVKLTVEYRCPYKLVGGWL